MSAGTADINNKISSRLSALRLRMETKGVSAVFVPTADPHGSEYIADHFKVREYLSGFTGSAGSLFVLKDEAFLFTDSRYFIQAEAELKGTGICLMKMGTQGVPLLSDFIRSKLGKNDVLALDGYMISAEFADKISCVKIDTDFDPVAGIWNDRPLLAFSDPYPIDDKYAGESSENKLIRIREEMLLSGCDTHLISSLSDIAWICNLRADDIKHTPVFYSYMIIKKDKAVLFAGPDVLNDPWKKIKDLLLNKGIELLPYSDINEGVTDLLKDSESILVNEKEINLKLKQLILNSGTKITDKPDPSKLFKAVKNTAEINGMKNAHIKDAVAVTQFIIKMKEYGTVIVTLADEDKEEALPLVRRFYHLGFNIEATVGTATYLKENGIRTRMRGKLSDGSDEVLKSIRAGYVSYIINTRSILSGVHYNDGVAIRQCAVENGVTMFTSLDTVRILLDVLEEISPEISTI